MLPGIGVFGTGSIVKALVPILQENGFHIEALWHHNLQEAQDTALQLSILFSTDRMDDVLLRKGVDLVFVLCAPILHAQISVKALGIGKHVVCDRPAGLHQADALKMVKAGQYYPSLISLINHSFRFLPAFSHMRRLISELYVGDRVSLIDVRIQNGLTDPCNGPYSWMCDGNMGGGVLSLLGSHVVDLVSYLLDGRKAIRVHGVLRTFRPCERGIRYVTAPDFCSFQMEMDGGTLITVHLNTTQKSAYRQEVNVSGPDGQLWVSGGDLYGFRNNFGENGVRSEERLYVDVEDLHDGRNEDMPKTFVKGLCKMVSALREAFLPTANGGGSGDKNCAWVKQPVRQAATFEDGLYVQAVLEAIRQSAATRRWIKVEQMTEPPDENALLSAAVRRTAISQMA